MPARFPNLKSYLDKNFFWPFMIYPFDPDGPLPQRGDELSIKEGCPQVKPWQWLDPTWVPESPQPLHCAAPPMMYIQIGSQMLRNFWKLFLGTVGRFFLSLDVSSLGTNGAEDLPTTFPKHSFPTNCHLSFFSRLWMFLTFAIIIAPTGSTLVATSLLT